MTPEQEKIVRIIERYGLPRWAEKIKDEFERLNAELASNKQAVEKLISSKVNLGSCPPKTNCPDGCLGKTRADCWREYAFGGRK
jgi:hypothetical protein